MNKILSFAGSNSSRSINYQLLHYVQEQYLPEMELVDIRNWELPLFGVDLEQKIGSPDDILRLYEKIQSCDTLLIGTPEHNGNMTAFMKSTLDWLSRKDREFLNNCRVFIIGTSPGRGGAQGSIANLGRFVERLSGQKAPSFSLPSFGHVFEDGRLIPEHADRLTAFISQLTS